MRYPAPRESNTLARYAYSWDFKQDAQESVPIPSPVVSRKAQLNIIEQDGGVLIDTSLSVRTQKTGQRLSISLTNELSSLISSLPKLGDTCFCTRLGKAYSSSGFASIWNRLMKKFTSSGRVRFHEHDIRGKTATDMNDPVAAQRLLGHSSITMTEAYIKQRQTDVVQPLRRKT